MKVLLIDIDSKIPNLALKKVEKYHLFHGDEIIWNNELKTLHLYINFKTKRDDRKSRGVHITSIRRPSYNLVSKFKNWITGHSKSIGFKNRWLV